MEIYFLFIDRSIEKCITEQNSITMVTVQNDL